MKSFLAIIGKISQIDPNLYKKIESLASRYLACAPGAYESKVWQSPSQRIALYSWTNEQVEDERTRCLWSDESHAFTLSGYVNDPSEDFFDLLMKKSRSEFNYRGLISRTGGLYSICYANGDKDTITVWNTITRIEPVYWCENNQYVFVGSRALLIHLLCENRTTPDYNFTNIVSFINNGFYNSEKTPFNNINVLSPNSEIEIKPNSVKIRTIDDTEEIIPSAPDSKFYNELTDALIASFLPLKRHNVELTSGLTGGKDSRLIVAALKHIGANFKTFTAGHPDHPDVVIARRISKILNLSHSVDIPKVVSISDEEKQTYDILSRAKNLLFVTDGMISAYENIPRSPQFNHQKVMLGGHGGELLRGGYAKILNHHDVSHMTKFFENSFMKFAPFMHTEPLKVYQQQLQSWIDQQPKRLNPIDILDKFYLYYDCGRWSASARAAYTSSYYLYQPFFDAKFVKLLQRVPCTYRLKDIILYNLIKRLEPKLLNVPFFADRWKFEAKGPRCGDEKLWHERAPLVAEKNSRAAFNWRNTCLTDMKDAFYDQIFNTVAAEDLFKVVKRDEIMKLFTSNVQGKQQFSHLLWALYTASVLLSNEWLKDTGSSRIVTIRIPRK